MTLSNFGQNSIQTSNFKVFQFSLLTFNVFQFNPSVKLSLIRAVTPFKNDVIEFFFTIFEFKKNTQKIIFR